MWVLMRFSQPLHLCCSLRTAASWLLWLRITLLVPIEDCASTSLTPFTGHDLLVVGDKGGGKSVLVREFANMMGHLTVRSPLGRGTVVEEHIGQLLSYRLRPPG